MILLYRSKHNFDVIRSAGNSTYNFVSPVRRDVVNAGFAGDNTTIRFQTDNAGPWILHWFVVLFSTLLLLRASNEISRSHIDWHLDLYVPFPLFRTWLHIYSFGRGLAVVFAEDVATITTENPPGQELFLFVFELQLNKHEIKFSGVGPAMSYLQRFAATGLDLNQNVGGR